MSCVCRNLAPFGVGAVVSVITAVAVAIPALGARYPRAMNHRGTMVPVVLGWALFAAIWIGVLTGATVAFLGSDEHLFSIAMPLALPILTLAGLYDDLRSGQGRGLLGHVRELLRRRITPGIVKLVAAVIAAIIVALAARASGVRLAFGVVVMAGSANVWNLLDVRPGRCAKAFLVAALPLVIVSGDDTFRLIGWTALAAMLALLPLDLRERGMLGDAGSNLLGFVVGIGLFTSLSTPGLVVAMAVILAIHVLSETVTLSRVIRVVPPLRWFDEVGRIRGPEPATHERTEPES
jgi:UDP-GlcNAc:undecaprenyl-phosphate/decaprenyl-phosphate GlcNAc-1-phosphate transferase